MTADQGVAAETCGKCASTNTRMGKRGWSIWTGLIGSWSKRVICNDCGNKWKPGKGG